MKKLLVLIALAFTMHAQSQQYFFEEYQKVIHGVDMADSITEISYVLVEFNVDYTTNIVVHLNGNQYTFKRLTEPMMEVDKDNDVYIVLQLRDIQDGTRYTAHIYEDYMFLLSVAYSYIFL